MSGFRRKLARRGARNAGLPSCFGNPIFRKKWNEKMARVQEGMAASEEFQKLLAEAQASQAAEENVSDDG